MISVTNPFLLLLAALNIAAAFWEFYKNHDWRIGCLFICYGVASVLLGIKEVPK